MALTVDGKVRGTPRGELFAGDVASARYTHTYQLTSDSPSADTEADVIAAIQANVGALASAYANDSSASLKQIRAYQSEVVTSKWFAEVEYSSELDAQGGQGGGGGSGQAPVDLSPELEYDFETIEELQEYDALGRPFTTSAGEPFEGGIVVPVTITVVTYSRWQSKFSATTIKNYVNRVNSGPFSGAGQRQVLMAGIRARFRPIAGTRLWWVTYVMKWRTDTWILKKPDRGTFHGSLKAPVYPAVASARGRGAYLPLNGAGGIASTGIPYQLWFDQYKLANFNSLGL